MADLTLLVLSGSLRSGSVNTIVADHVAAVTPDGVSVVRHPLDDVPLFNQDLEDAGDPDAVTQLKELTASCDGIVMVTPEYNVGVPAVTKNAVDWMSRPYGSGPITGQPFGVVAVSPGGRAGVGARIHLMDTLRILTERAYEETLGMGKIYDQLEDGRLGDEGADALRTWLAGFVAHVRG